MKKIFSYINNFIPKGASQKENLKDSQATEAYMPPQTKERGSKHPGLQRRERQLIGRAKSLVNVCHATQKQWDTERNSDKQALGRFA